MGHAPDWMRGSMKKTAPSTPSHGVTSRPIFHSESSTVQKFADGGSPGDSLDIQSYLKQGGLAGGSQKMTIPQATAGASSDAGNGATSYKVDSGAKQTTSSSTGSPRFGVAFAAARKAGLKEFEWNGKKYHTRLKGESDSTRKKASPQKSAASTASADLPEEKSFAADRTQFGAPEEQGMATDRGRIFHPTPELPPDPPEMVFRKKPDYRPKGMPRTRQSQMNEVDYL